MFNQDSEIILQDALSEATTRGHECVCLEHLLFALLQNNNGAQIIRACGGNVQRLKFKLEEFFNNKIEKYQGPKGREPHQTLAFQRVLQRAILHTEYSSSKIVTPGDLLAAIFTETESFAVYYLSLENISRLSILEYISHGMDESFDDGEFPFSDPNSEFGDSEQDLRNPLEKFTTCLTDLAKAEELDPLVGRDEELERTIHILCRRNKNNPLFVGDQGVGKTALAEGLAQRIVAGKVPEKLKNLKIYSLDLGSLIAGTRFRGDFEERFKTVLKALEKEKNVIIFIDEIHNIIGAGATSGGTLDAANLLKPILTKGNLRFIGSTTYEEYKNHFEKDRALARRFLKVEVKEPSVEETIKILEGLKDRFEEHHHVRYANSALKTAAELSAKYINERFLPDKAIDIIDEAGALLSLQQEAQATEENAENEKSIPMVKSSLIEKVISKIAQIPPRTVSTTERDKLKDLDSQLKQVVFGQDEAIAGLTLAIRRARAGLGAENKPIGSFLFAGPTGVGKTEVAKQIAKTLGLELIRFDMSEYMEKHTVARLIGSPPGYVGFEQGGLLTDAIIRHPHAVLLLDEIEKANPDIFNILLQVMDNATLTDNNGRKADFRNVIVIMTSNVGSENIFGNSIGFGENAPKIGQGAIDKHFRPEFRNRLDMIVKFSPLPLSVIEQVVDKFIVEIDSQLNKKSCTITISIEARKYIAEKGYNQQYGARAVYRYIQKNIKDKLADEVLFGKLANGGEAKIELKEEQLHFSFSSKHAPKHKNQLEDSKA
ncbi:MAG: ATP-dependent Clp protease ATP-binding subunit ClpA [Proteobacteria bacterium]|nr:ATP-dependent Clp protease ATP-binding subunit ClpA [Pseudomonadota bacterium]